jgi:predicted secreted protein
MAKSHPLPFQIKNHQDITINSNENKHTGYSIRIYVPRDKRVLSNAPFILDHVKIGVAYPTIQHLECHVLFPCCSARN